MLKREKIFELRIEEEDDISGIDSISLVDEPAIEYDWVAFNRECKDGCGLNHDFSSDDDKYVSHLMTNAETEDDLLNNGWVIDSFEVVTGKEDFVYTDPNGPSIEDEEEYKVRYKYALNPNISGPALISTSRPFCRELITQNKVFRVEDIENAINDFGQSPLVYRGSWNCRHSWLRIKYRNDAVIVNKASVNKGKTTVLGLPNDIIPDARVLGYDEPSTITDRTRANPSPSTIRNLGLSKDNFEVGVPHYTKDGKLYEGPTHKDADGRLMTGEVHTEDSEYLYHKGEIESFAGRKVSIDYDDTLSTQRGQRLARHLMMLGNDVYVVTRRRSYESGPVYRISDELGIPRSKVIFTDGRLKWETLRRLGITRHYDNNPDEISAIKKNAPLIEAIQFDYDVTSLPPYKEELPKTGKTENESFESYNDYPESAKNNAKKALDWAEKNGWGDCGTPVGKQRANQLANGENISEETISRMASFERHRQNKDVPYSEGCGGLMWDAWGGTSGIEWAQNKLEEIEKGKNSMSKQKFASDDEKRIVLGPAMVPNQKIIRKDKVTGEPYFVYFSSETIKMIAEKYMRNKYIDNNDTQHDGKVVEDVYVIESWIKESDHDKSNKYGFNELPIGTWFVAMKIRNDEVWQRVKNGELNGFSVSGYFEEVSRFSKEEMFLYKLAEILKEN
jgi:hypothetical protein